MINFILGFLLTIFLIAVIVFCLIVGGDKWYTKNMNQYGIQ